MRRTATPATPGSPESARALLFTSIHTRLPSDSRPPGTNPKSTVRLLLALPSPSPVGSPLTLSVTGPLRTTPPPMVTPLSSLSTSLSGFPDEPMSVLDVELAGGTTSTKYVPGSRPVNR